MDIERFALSKILESIAKCDVLQSNFETNDKTPSWDGFVYVYNNSNKAKREYQGRVPVQIKGTEKLDIDLEKEQISFPMEVSDLRNYYKDCGCVVFVVYITKDFKHRIYYNSLLPFDLRKILEVAKDQQTITIALDVFPENDQKEVTTIFFDFLHHSELQKGTKGIILDAIDSFEDLQKSKIDIDNIVVPSPGSNLIELCKYLTTHEHYVYAETKDKVLFPFEKVKKASRVTLLPRKIQIEVNGTKFYDESSLCVENGKEVVKIGKSFTYRPFEKNFNFKLNGNLSERIIDCRFFIELSDSGKIIIDGKEGQVNIDDGLIEEAKKIREILKFLELTKLLFEKLGVKKELDFEKITDSDSRLIAALIEGIINNAYVTVDNLESWILPVKIANLHILLVAIKSKEKKDRDRYRIYNFFEQCEKNCYMEYKMDSGSEPIKSSVYFLLEKKDFLKFDNISYDNILKLVKNLPKYEANHTSITNLILSLLRAYDEQKEDEMLKTANSLNEHIVAFYGETPITVLNKLQIIRRQRRFSDEEIEILKQILSSNDDLFVLLGANILLERSLDAESVFEKLPEEKKQEFLSFPICFLWIRR